MSSCTYIQIIIVIYILISVNILAHSVLNVITVCHPLWSCSVLGILLFIMYMLVGWLNSRTSVSDRRTFTGLHRTCS